MTSTLLRRLHPVYRLRQYALGRTLLRQLDGEVWLRPDSIAFPIRGRRIQHSAMWHGYEPNVRTALGRIVRDRELESFWDIGANNGFYSWLLKTMQPAVQVESFEPDPRNAALMRATMHHTHIEGITLNEMALGDRCGVAQFTFDDVSGMAGCVTESDQYSLVRTTYGGARTADVPIFHH